MEEKGKKKVTRRAKLAVSAEAARKLRRVVKTILAEPKRFYMRGFALAKADFFTDGSEGLAVCNTAACIGGWVVILDHVSKPCEFEHFVRTHDVNYYEDEAQKILGITAQQTDRLFRSHHWPEPFNSQFNRGEDLSAKPEVRESNAKVAAARIEHFIRTGE